MPSFSKLVVICSTTTTLANGRPCNDLEVETSVEEIKSMDAEFKQCETDVWTSWENVSSKACGNKACQKLYKSYNKTKFPDCEVDKVHFLVLLFSPPWGLKMDYAEGEFSKQMSQCPDVLAKAAVKKASAKPPASDATMVSLGLSTIAVIAVMFC